MYDQWSCIDLFGHAVFQAFTNTLYNLAANPEYAQPLREEVEAIVEEEGWSRTSLSKMRKVDSFLRESICLDGIVSQLPPSTCPLVTACMRGVIVPRRLLLMIMLISFVPC